MAVWKAVGPLESCGFSLFMERSPPGDRATNPGSAQSPQPPGSDVARSLPSGENAVEIEYHVSADGIVWTGWYPWPVSPAHFSDYLQVRARHQPHHPWELSPISLWSPYPHVQFKRLA